MKTPYNTIHTNTVLEKKLQSTTAVGNIGIPNMHSTADTRLIARLDLSEPNKKMNN